MGTFSSLMIKYFVKTFINIRFASEVYLFLALFRLGGWGEGVRKPPLPTSFSPVISIIVGLAHKTFWLVFITLLIDWCKISSLYLVPVPNYWTWTKTAPEKKRFFWSNPYKIELMNTSLIQMLQIPNFGHMTTATI